MKPASKNSRKRLTLVKRHELKGALRFCVAFLVYAPLAHGATAELIVNGSIRSHAEKAECMAQLLRPDGYRATFDVVSRSFSARLPYAVGEGPYLLEMRCDGYRVFTSSTLALNTMRETISVGRIDPALHLDTDGCRELYGEAAASALRRMIPVFEQSHGAPLAKVRIGIPIQCPRETSVFLQGIEDYSGPGMHWTVSMDKGGDKVIVEPGL